MGPDLIDFVQFTPEVVFNVLHSLPVDKVCGPDLLPAKLLKEGAESICVPLSRLFQRSFEVGILPFVQMLCLLLNMVIGISQQIIGPSVLPHWLLRLWRR